MTDEWKPTYSDFVKVNQAAIESQKKLYDTFVEMSVAFAGIYSKLEERVAATVQAFEKTSTAAVKMVLAPHDCEWIDDGWECRRCGHASADLQMMVETKCVE